MEFVADFIVPGLIVYWVEPKLGQLVPERLAKYESSKADIQYAMAYGYFPKHEHIQKPNPYPTFGEQLVFAADVADSLKAMIEWCFKAPSPQFSVTRTAIGATHISGGGMGQFVVD